MALSNLVNKLRKVELQYERLKARRQAELRALPSKLGFDSVEELIAALREAHPTSGRGRQANANRVAALAASALDSAGLSVVDGPRRPRRKRRAHITDAVKTRLQELLVAGKRGTAIARELGLSVASVQNIKKSLGLTKPRQAKPATDVAAPQ